MAPCTVGEFSIAESLSLSYIPSPCVSFEGEKKKMPHY